MFVNVYEINVDLKKKMSTIVPTYVKYDSAELVFKIFDNGVPFDLTGFTQAEVFHRRPDGVTVIGDGTIETDSNGDKVIRYKYLGNEMYNTGVVATTLSVYSGDKKVSIHPFSVNIVADFKDAMVDPSNPEYGALQELVARVDRLVTKTTETLQEVMDALDVVEGVTDKAYAAIDAMENATTEAIDAMETATTEAVENMESATESAIDEMETATSEAVEATERVIIRAEGVIDNMIEGYNTTVLIWKAYVNTRDDIDIAYPNPSIGWTTQVYDTGIRYRWSGTEWVPIEASGGNIPIANENIDGLMSKESFQKLKNISDNINTRTVVFIIPQEVLAGIQDPHIVFPFKGEIVDLSASVSIRGTSETFIRLEKSRDYVSWDNLTTTPIKIPTQQFFSDSSYALTDRKVSVGDIFRLYIPLTGDVQNLTVNVSIKTEN